MLKNKDGTGRKITHRPSLSERNKRLMFAVLIRNDSSFRQLRNAITDDSFDPDDAHYMLLWRVVLKYYDEYSCLPDLEFLKGEVAESLRVYGDELDPDHPKQLYRFLEWAFSQDRFPEPVATSRKYSTWAINRARQYLEEGLESRLRQSLPDVAGTSAVDIPEMLHEAYMESRRIRSVVANSNTKQFSDDWKERMDDVPRIMMAMPCFTKFMGGMAPGEIYGLLGPYGSAKTTMTYQIAVDMCKVLSSARKKGGGVRPLVFVASYEAPRDEMRERTMGYSATIHRSTMGPLRSVSKELSRTRSLKDYEKNKWKLEIKRGYPVMGEYERFQAAVRMLEDHIVLFDMTGSDPDMPGAGSGGVVEIASRIDAHLRANDDTTCAMLIIDYAKAMAKRFLGAENLGDDRLRKIIEDIPLHVRNEVALRHKCPVWITQQMGADANKRRPGAVMHHTDASECRTFGENCDFCFCMGNQTKQQILAVWCSKHRRTPPSDPSLVYVDGSFYCTKPADRTWMLDMGSKRITRRDGDSSDIFEASAPSTRAKSDPVVDV